MNAAKWCGEVLEEWAQANKEILELRFTEKEASSLLRQARIKRSEEKLALAAIKADVAAMVQQLMKGTDKGRVEINILSPLLNVELTWDERLPAATK